MPHFAHLFYLAKKRTRAKTMARSGSALEAIEALEGALSDSSVSANNATRAPMHVGEPEAALFALIRGTDGGVARSEGGIRPDGVRGLMATQDLLDGEVAVWIPNPLVLSEPTVDSSIRQGVDAAIKETMGETPMSGAEVNVYRTMSNLCAGYMLEKARGSSAPFAIYVASLPDPPSTFNTWSQVPTCDENMSELATR